MVADMGMSPTPLSLAQVLAQFQAQLEILGNLASSKGPPSLAPALLFHHLYLVRVERQSLAMGWNENAC